MCLQKFTSRHKQGLGNSAKTHAPLVVTGRQADERTAPRTRLAAASPRPGCSPSVTQRTPSGGGDPPPHPTGGSRRRPATCPWGRPLVCGPWAGKVLCPVRLVFAQAGANNDVPPSWLRAPGEAAHRERGCYGNLRRMELGTARHLESGTEHSPWWQRGQTSALRPPGWCWG